MKRVGIVEGYYGKIPTFEQRKKIISSLSEHGLNFYMYAPKEDPFLRLNIDIDHTENWLREFDDFIAHSQNMSVEVGIGLAPIYKNKTEALKSKIQNFSDRGVKFFSILFDDIEENFSFFDQIETYRAIKDKFPNLYFDFCPTVYAGELIDKNSAHQEYFKEFNNSFPKHEVFFWTGEKVISEKMGISSQEHLQDFANTSIAIWDNYFTVDSCPKKLNLSFFDYLQHEFIFSKDCYLVNLTGMPRTDNLIVDMLGSFYAQKETSYEEILLKHGVDERLIEQINLFNPKVKVNLKKEDKDKIHKIMFTWFHPLKNEWYPYLHNLKNWE